MFWLIQNNFYSKNNFEILISNLEKLNLEYETIDIANNINISKYPQNTIICGGNFLSNIAIKNNWKFGSFLNDNFSYLKWRDIYKDNLLNYPAIVDKLDYINPTWDNFFMRPLEDTKYFNGGVISKKEFKIFKDNVYNNIKSDIIKNSLVVISKVKDIYSEYRFFIINNKIITYSQYKSGGQVYLSEFVPNEAINFVSNIINIWQPAKAFVVDIAYTDEGYKIVEFNNFNASGFYACNVQKIIEAIETYADMSE